MTENELRSMLNTTYILKCEINRMVSTKDLAEFDTMYGHAKKNLEKLSEIIYNARFKEEYHE